MLRQALVDVIDAAGEKTITFTFFKEGQDKARILLSLASAGKITMDQAEMARLSGVVRYRAFNKGERSFHFTVGPKLDPTTRAQLIGAFPEALETASAA